MSWHNSACTSYPGNAYSTWATYPDEISLNSPVDWNYNLSPVAKAEHLVSSYQWEIGYPQNTPTSGYGTSTYTEAYIQRGNKREAVDSTVEAGNARPNTTLKAEIVEVAIPRYSAHRNTDTAVEMGNTKSTPPVKPVRDSWLISGSFVLTVSPFADLNRSTNVLIVVNGWIVGTGRSSAMSPQTHI